VDRQEPFVFEKMLRDKKEPLAQASEGVSCDRFIFGIKYTRYKFIKHLIAWKVLKIRWNMLEAQTKQSPSSNAGRALINI
jgi:hypothetical protein